MGINCESCSREPYFPYQSTICRPLVHSTILFRNPEPVHGTMPPVTVRKATYSDLDALTSIGIAAFPHEPQWPYRYPHAARFPKDHLKFTRLRYAEWIEASNSGDCAIMVAEAPSIDDENQYKVVSMSIWRLPLVDKPASDNSAVSHFRILLNT